MPSTNPSVDATVLATEHVAQLTLANGHRRTGRKSSPQPLVGRACVGFGQTRPVAIETPRGGRVPNGEGADAIRLCGDRQPAEMAVRELAQRRVSLTHCVLQPPRDAAARRAQAEGLVDTGVAAREKIAERAPEPTELCGAQLLMIPAALTDLAQLFDDSAHGESCRRLKRTRRARQSRRPCMGYAVDGDRPGSAPGPSLPTATAAPTPVAAAAAASSTDAAAEAEADSAVCAGVAIVRWPRHRDDERDQ